MESRNDEPGSLLNAGNDYSMNRGGPWLAREKHT